MSTRMFATTMNAAATTIVPMIDRQVLLSDRLHRELTEPGQTEDVLDDDHAAEQRPEVDAELRDDRRERAAQPVSVDRPAARVRPLARAVRM